MRINGRFAILLLTLLIVMKIVDFFNLLQGDLGFIKKVVTLSVLAALFYKVNFTWLFLGQKKADYNIRVVNISILALYMIFSFKEFIVLASVTKDAVLFAPLIDVLWQQAGMLNTLSFYIGGIGLLLVAGFLAWYGRIEETSLLGHFHMSSRSFVVRWMALFLLLVSFFVLVFDLLVEWLAIAASSLLLLFGIFFYLFVIIKFHHHFSPERFVHKIGSFGKDFEEKFIKFFHDEDHVWLGITGLLVLHLLTEVANFLVPYVFSVSSVYFKSLGHHPLWEIFVLDIALANPFVVSLLYLLNILFIFLIVLLPAFMWYELYSGEVKRLWHWLIGVFFAGILPFLLTPLFYLAPIRSGQFIGVDIIASSIVGENLVGVLIAGLIFGIGMYCLSFVPKVKHVQYHLIIVSALVFLSYYLGLFYVSTTEYFSNTLQELFLQKEYYLFVIIALFFGIKVGFYVFGSVKFFIQLARKHIL